MKIANSLVAGVFCLGLGQLASAQASCTIFEHHDYLGRFIALGDGQCMRDMRAYDFNDIGSSVQVAEGCEARLYEHIEFYGCGVFYDSDTAKFADIEGVVAQCDDEATGAKENDRASSMFCTCDPEALSVSEAAKALAYAECEVLPLPLCVGYPRLVEGQVKQNGQYCSSQCVESCDPETGATEVGKCKVVLETCKDSKG